MIFLFPSLKFSNKIIKWIFKKIHPFIIFISLFSNKIVSPRITCKVVTKRKLIKMILTSRDRLIAAAYHLCYISNASLRHSLSYIITITSIIMAKTKCKGLPTKLWKKYSSRKVIYLKKKKLNSKKKKKKKKRGPSF